MDPAGLESYVNRAQALVDAAAPTTRRETRTLLVDPLLETLGWDLRSAGRRGDEAIPGVDLEYVLSVEGAPGLFVDVEPFPAALTADQEDALGRAMAATGVDRAIYTNGREVRLLAGRSPPERFACEVDGLEDAAGELEHVSRRGIAERLRRNPREAAARRLAVDRASLESAIADELATRAGTASSAEFREETRAFVDGVIRRLAAGPESAETAGAETDRRADATDSVRGGSGPGWDDADRRGGEGGRRRIPPARGHPVDPDAGDAGAGTGDEAESIPGGENARGSDTEGTDEEDREADAADPSECGASRSKVDVDTDAGDARDADGEYVVRFFNERGSIGAVGHSRSEGAMAAAVEYLFERGLSGVRLPWRPEGDAVVLHTDPVLADGTPMDAAVELSNGTHLNTGGTLARRAGRIEALAERAGLRAMLDGDWDARSDAA